MKDQEAIEMMRRASAEIKGLRQRIEHLQPLADAYENMAALISVAIQPKSVGMGEDLVWRLDKRIREIEEQLAEAAQPSPPKGPDQ